MWSRKIAKGVSDIMITMHKVSSSNVHSVGYDEINKNLYVKFLNNSTYIFVPKNAMKLRFDKSFTRFFSKNRRCGQSPRF